MLKSMNHLECFYHFLCSFCNGVETLIVFWLAVEDMKDAIGDTRVCNTKIRRIMRRFFKETLDISKICFYLLALYTSLFLAVYCQDSSVLEISGMDNPSPFQLMDAQEAVAKILESKW